MEPDLMAEIANKVIANGIDHRKNGMERAGMLFDEILLGHATDCRRPAWTRS
jgi:hypothetical protein